MCMIFNQKAGWLLSANLHVESKKNWVSTQFLIINFKVNYIGLIDAYREMRSNMNDFESRRMKFLSCKVPVQHEI